MIKRIDKGYSFNLSKRISGYALLIIGAFLIIGVSIIIGEISVGFIIYFILAIILTTTGTLLALSREYILIEGEKMTTVLNIIGFQKKRYNKLDYYKHISIISRLYNFDNKESFSASSIAMPSIQATEIKHDLIFTTKNQFGRLLIGEFNDYQQAYNIGLELEKVTGKQLVKYAPKRLKNSKHR